MGEQGPKREISLETLGEQEGLNCFVAFLITHRRAREIFEKTVGMTIQEYFSRSLGLMDNN